MDIIKKFNIINQTELDTKLLVCAGCKGWLTSAIFLCEDPEDDWSYCEACAETRDEPGIRQYMLEDMISKSKLRYPCGNSECSWIESVQNIQEHMKVCPYGPFKCLYCEEEDLNEFKIVTHLEEKHPDMAEKLSIEDPIITLKLEVPFTCTKIFVIDLRGHTLIVIVANDSYYDRSFHISVGKETVFNSIPSCDFLIQYDNLQKKGTISNIKQIFEDVGESFWLEQSIEDEECKEIELKMYLCGFELSEQCLFDECPICDKPVSSDIYQCQNGHNVCHKCIEIIKICAICRLEMNRRTFKLKYLGSKFQFPCPNADAGCLMYMKGSDLDTHLHVCLYSTVNCIECNEEHPKKNIVQHMQKTHNVCNNIVELSWTVTDCNKLCKSTEYVEFRGLLFRFTRSCNSNSYGNIDLSYNVQLLYNYNKEEAQKYRYEVHILSKDWNCIPNLKVGHVCQALNDNTTSLAVDWNLCKKFIYTDNERLALKTWYCVYEINE